MKRFDLEMELSYRLLKTGYNQLLRWREWVSGFPVEITISVTNRSPKAFPKAKINIDFLHHGQSIGVKPLGWSLASMIEIPKLKAEESAILESVKYTPFIEGLCEIKIKVEEPTDSEVWVAGWRQGTPRRKEISEYFSVVRWQELEMLKLLGKMAKGG